MRAVAIFPAEKRIGLTNQPEPQIMRETEAKLRVIEVGVCGTDREIARLEYGTPPAGSDHLIIGHESLAQVVDVGRSVTRVRTGDLVVTTVRRPCPHASCPACRAGRQDFCFTGDFTERGINGQHGFMTEMVVDDERFMHVLPAALRDVGVLIEPLTIAEKALIQIWDMQDRLPWTAPGRPPGDGHGQRAVVLGAGPVGLLGCLALLVRGFETWVYSREGVDGPKAQWASTVGAHYISASTTPPAALAAEVGNIDLLYEATGAASVSFQVMEALGVNGVFVFTGVPGRKAPIEVNADLIMRNLVLKNQLVFGTVNAGPDAFAAAVSDLTQFYERWPVPLRSLISGRYAPEAAEDLLLGPPGGIKQVVVFSEAR
jgi:threonine dehydrogenase-like Zn-dependent dehydrogenase